MNLYHYSPARFLASSAIVRYSFLTFLIFLSQVFLNLSLLPTAFAANVTVPNSDGVGPVNAITSTRQLGAGGTYTLSTIKNHGGQPNALLANMVGQLRVTPDRVASIDPGQEITFTLLVRNIGFGTGRDIKVKFPVDPNLVVGYASFTDPKAWVSELTPNFLTITYPNLDSDQEVSTIIVLRPASTAQTGSEISSRALINFSDDRHSDASTASNMVRFSLGSNNQTRNDTDGAVQYFRSATISAFNGATIELAGDFYSPGELVTFWYTSPDNISQPIGTQVANAQGVVVIDFTPSFLKTGTRYTVSGQGQWSGVTCNAVLTIITTKTDF